MEWVSRRVLMSPERIRLVPTIATEYEIIKELNKSVTSLGKPVATKALSLTRDDDNDDARLYSPPQCGNTLNASRDGIEHLASSTSQHECKQYFYPSSVLSADPPVYTPNVYALWETRGVDDGVDRILRPGHLNVFACGGDLNGQRGMRMVIYKMRRRIDHAFTPMAMGDRSISVITQSLATPQRYNLVTTPESRELKLIAQLVDFILIVGDVASSQVKLEHVVGLYDLILYLMALYLTPEQSVEFSIRDVQIHPPSNGTGLLMSKCPRVASCRFFTTPTVATR
ncbi:hypothetical protein WN51_00764 [Melipona quadrifasciata]|uniref:Uncharacterized protein n=1 Tax=Melipona quadrifasciata TaxID=166423 RepID=A0A0N0U4Y5_9HYME|nr:hypothetical protein WN51_00764 [Melipona quadrifasciata]